VSLLEIVLDNDEVKMKVNISVIINGEQKYLSVNYGDKLVDVLRKYGYKGVRKGCYEGSCGACVVLLNGKNVNSCLVLAVSVDGMEITTIEGLGTMSEPHILQSSILETGGVQCGYCTPGFLLSAYALFLKNKNPDDDELIKALDGNYCRCTGYVKKIEGVKLGFKKVKK
jgi:aerobic carbon-monoxide dehydrogenase small subunit